MHASTGCGLLLLGLASNVSAQNTTFDPAAISTPEKEAWCASELQACSTLCNGSFQSSNDNACNTFNLATTCKCADGSTPDLSQFTNTVPTFECQYQLAHCQSNATTTSETNACAFQYVCGDRDATQIPGTTITSLSISSSGTAAPTSTSQGQQEQTTSTSTIASSTTTTKTSSKVWIAGPVIGVILFIAALVTLLWYLRRKRSHADTETWTPPDQPDYVTKAELHAESKEPQVSELAGQSRTAELQGGMQRSPVELHGSSRLVELDAT